MIFAGLPATTALSGISFKITLPAPIIEFAPIVTGIIVALLPITAPDLINMGFHFSLLPVQPRANT